MMSFSLNHNLHHFIEDHMAVKLEGQKRLYHPKNTDEVKCLVHGLVTTWGALNAIQQLALEEGLDTTEDLPCLLAGSNL